MLDFCNLGKAKNKTQLNMKKSFLAIALIGALAISCGEKKESNTEAKDNAATTEEVVDTKKQELTYSLEWTAFKTPAKAGVKGTFSDIKLNGVKEDAASLVESLSGSSFVVVTSSVNTNDAGRDEKLKADFFAKMVGNINGFFGEFKDGKVIANITMNGISKEKEMTYVATEDEVTINGTIDIISDFTAKGAFDSLHEACKDLHEGKTWTDVNIAVVIKK